MTDMFYLNPYKITRLIRYHTALSHCNRFFLLIVKSSLSESSLSVESVGKSVKFDLPNYFSFVNYRKM